MNLKKEGKGKFGRQCVYFDVVATSFLAALVLHDWTKVLLFFSDKDKIIIVANFCHT